MAQMKERLWALAKAEKKEREWVRWRGIHSGRATAQRTAARRALAKEMQTEATKA